MGVDFCAQAGDNIGNETGGDANEHHRACK
jgi:hypothetical protein